VPATLLARADEVIFGTVEISEYREPNSPILTARQCPS
jgi:hypothetical protein